MYRSLPLLLMLAFPLGLMLPGCSHLPFVPESGGPSVPPPSIRRLLDTEGAGASQLLLVTVRDRAAVSATVRAFEKQGNEWREVFSPVEAVIGRNGFAAPGEKREGDGKTPSGSFALARTFGYAPAAPTRMSYRQATRDDIWVDDPASPDYNRWCTKGQTSALSFEKMLRDDGLYRVGIVVEYNTDPVLKGSGSAIFLHIWKGKGIGTSGCIAMDEQMVHKLLGWLDPARQPRIIMGVVSTPAEPPRSNAGCTDY